MVMRRSGAQPAGLQHNYYRSAAQFLVSVMHKSRNTSQEHFQPLPASFIEIQQ